MKHTGVFPSIIANVTGDKELGFEGGYDKMQWNNGLNENGLQFFGGDSADIGGSFLLTWDMAVPNPCR